MVLVALERLIEHELPGSISYIISSLLCVHRFFRTFCFILFNAVLVAVGKEK